MSFHLGLIIPLFFSFVNTLGTIFFFSYITSNIKNIFKTPQYPLDTSLFISLSMVKKISLNISMLKIYWLLSNSGITTFENLIYKCTITMPFYKFPTYPLPPELWQNLFYLRKQYCIYVPSIPVLLSLDVFPILSW